MMTMLKTMLLLLLLLQLTIHHTSTEVPPHRHHRRHLPTSVSDVPHKFSVEQRKALQQVIRTMMGFGKDEVPPPHAAGLLRLTDGGGGSSGGAHPSSLSSGGGQVAPRYMHRLYEKYRIAETEGGTKGMADTVRNMNAELVICNNGTLFAFNLTSIAESESVLRAEIHIYKRRPRVSSHSNESSTAELPQPSSPEPPGFIVIKAYELGPGVLRERTSFRLPDAGHSGWTIFDVTSAVKDCASTMRSGNATHMLALGFSLDDEDTDGRSRSRSNTGKLLTLSKFVRKLSKPFLMVFSQENRSNYLDAQLDVLSQRSGEDRPSDKPGAIDEDSWRWVYDNPILLHHDRSLASRRKSRLLPPAFRSRVMWSSPSEVRGSKRRNLSDEIFAMESPPSGPDLIWNTTGRVFQKFAVEEEAIGGLFRRRFYHAGFEPDPLYPPLHPPNIVPAARNLRDRRRKRHVVADNEIPQDVAFPDPDPVPFVYYNLPKTNPGILRGRSEQQPGKKKKEQQSTPRPADIAFGSAAHDDEEEKGPRQRRRGTKGRLLSAVVPGRHRGRGGGRRRNGAREEDEEEEVCGKRKLVVDFADIGWREWIISPRSFEAHYCDGLCSYPMAPRLRPTNHATIQSIVKAIGLQTDVPSPCCIPASLSSVTLLYFDQNQNVVLKNYPDMTVRSCACR